MIQNNSSTSIDPIYVDTAGRVLIRTSTSASTSSLASLAVHSDASGGNVLLASLGHVTPTTQPFGAQFRIEYNGLTGLFTISASKQGNNTNSNPVNLAFATSTSQSGSTAATRMRIISRGSGTGTAYVHIGGSDENPNMNVGLTITQGAGQQQVVCLRNSTLNHGQTDNGTGLTIQTSDYLTINENLAGSGGAMISAFATTGTNSPFQLRSWGGLAHTTKNQDSRGLFVVNVSRNPSVDNGNINANGNVFAVIARRANSNPTVFIVDVNGNLYVDGSSTITTYDNYNDAELVRSYDLVMGNKEQIIRNKFDDFVRYNNEDLVEAGIIGEVTEEEEARGVKPLINVTGLQRLHNGAIWQLYQSINLLAETISELGPEAKEKLENKFGRDGMPRLLAFPKSKVA